MTLSSVTRNKLFLDKAKSDVSEQLALNKKKTIKKIN